MTVVIESPDTRTFYGAVARVLRACGIPDPGTLNNANMHTQRAMQCVQEAVQEIWYAAPWDFRLFWLTLELAEDQMWYDPPDDFDSPALDYLGEHEKTVGLEYIAYEKLFEMYPHIRNLPLGYGATLKATIQAAEDATNEIYHGAPVYWTYTGNQIGVFPIPEEDYIADYSNYLIGQYYRVLTTPSEDTDEIPLSPSLFHVQHSLALALFKQILEYGDFPQTEARARHQLRMQIARLRKVYRSHYQLMPGE